LPDCIGSPTTACRSLTAGKPVVELLRTERLELARSLLDRALQQGWLQEYELDGAIRDGSGRTGNGQLRRLLAEIEPGAHAESERRLHQLLRRAAITGWVPQYEVRLPSGVAFIDIAFPEPQLAVEVDGRRHHDDGSDRFDSDRQRHNELVAMGWRVIRVTWTMLPHPPTAVRPQFDQLRAASGCHMCRDPVR
jgi:very-short-patch-repair endonuclease